MNRILALFLLAAGAFAQTPLATVTGLATDPAGAAVTSVTITLINKDTGVQRTARTNESGAYSLPNLPPGAYSLAAEAPGFRKIQIDAFALEAFRTLRQDLKFEVASAATEITVTESSSTVIQTETPCPASSRWAREPAGSRRARTPSASKSRWTVLKPPSAISVTWITSRSPRWNRSRSSPPTS